MELPVERGSLIGKPSEDAKLPAPMSIDPRSRPCAASRELLAPRQQLRERRRSEAYRDDTVDRLAML